MTEAPTGQSKHHPTRLCLEFCFHCVGSCVPGMALLLGACQAQMWAPPTHMHGHSRTRRAAGRLPILATEMGAVEGVMMGQTWKMRAKALGPACLQASMRSLSLK